MMILFTLKNTGAQVGKKYPKNALYGCFAVFLRVRRPFQTSQRRGRCAEYHIIIIRKYIDF